jgi:phospholipid-binding lipoprotein MlaA
MTTSKELTTALAFIVGLGFSPAYADEESDNKDPFEPINRVTSEFNRGLRTLVINPFAELYKAVTPPPAQEVISNTASNLTEPLTAVSSFLQGDSENAGTSLERFLINTTIGLGGTSDRATEMGVKSRQEDLGQAAGVQGIDSGPHIVLPVFGPSNMRDATGTIINALVNPLALASTADDALTYADNKDKLAKMEKTAVDPYVLERDAYEQRRKYVIHNGMLVPSMDEYADEDDRPLEQNTSQ